MQCLVLVAMATILLTLSETSKGQLENDITTLGCFEDANNRDLPIVHHASDLTTKAYCWRYCHSNGYRYFGMQDGAYCTCGNTYGKYRRVAFDECNAVKCKGDGLTPCGNAWRNVIFTTGLDRSVLVWNCTDKSGNCTDAQIRMLGCFEESQASQLAKDFPLQHAADQNRASKHYCWAYCHSRGFVYFVPRDGQWCACGNSYGRYGRAVADSECKMPCSILSKKFCGGLHRNLIFTTGVREANKTRLGCFAVFNSRFPELPLVHESPAGMNSAQYCGHFCVSNGYRYFGLMPGNLCSCGAAASRTYGRVSDTECDQACGPATTETCGAANRIEIFDSGALNLANQAAYLGCYADSSSARDLSAIEHNMGGEATKYYCWRLCFDRGYRYFGLQASVWCYCGNTFGRHSRLARDQCSSRCKGDATVTCGGDYRNNVYATGFEDSSNVKTIACLNDSFVKPQLPLVTQIPVGEGLNASQYCLHLCRSKGYRHFAVRSVTTCSCGSLLIYVNLRKILNSTANCGSDPANHVISTGVEDWESGVIHLGCFVDGVERDLPVFHNAEGLATKYYCWKYCHSRGYRYFGLQSRSYCMCGNSYGKYEHLPDSECRRMRCQGDESAWCADAMRNIIFTTGVEPWDKSVTRFGCFEHNATNRDLPLTHNAGIETRHQYCWHYCHSRGFKYFGIRSGVYCSCGNALSSNRQVNDTECSTRCMGDPSSTCGGELRNEIFTTGVEEWENRVVRVGCYSDRNHDRDLRVFHRLGHVTSKYACWRYCKMERNWRYFGLQGGEYCTCGDSFGRHGRLDDSACDIKCLGDGSSTCGGNERNELFSTGLDNWESAVERLGCFADQSGTRDLPVEHRAGSQASKHRCWLYCRSRGYRYFSLQAREFCYCGNSYGRYGRAANGECNLKCLGEPFQTCGGDMRNEIFTTGVESWEQGITRLGCFYDNTASPGLPLKFDAGIRLTKKFCWNHCRQRGYKLFGLQDGRMCLCGNSHGRYGRSDEEACHERCRGDYSTTCGAENRSEIYTTGIADWENGTLRLGCFADNSVNPDMPLAHAMLQESASKYTCWQLCSSRGYAYFGLQGRSWCLCGNTNIGKSHVMVENSKCNEKCSGEDGNLCGGHLKTQVFKTGVDYNPEISASRIGCFVDSDADGRDLPLMHQAAGIMATRHDCRTHCRSKGYRYFGLQAGQWCTCGNAYGRHGEAADSRECGVRCQGDAGVTCGGRMRNEVFRT